MTMLEYIKMILRKVSFDTMLFEKELKKALKTLSMNEIKTLKEWCYQEFGNLYQRILNRAFARLRGVAN
jgi:hypothetical protein